MEEKVKEIRDIKGVLIVVVIMIILISIYNYRAKYVELELVTSIKNENIDVNSGENEFLREVHWWFINPTSENLYHLGQVAPDLESQRIVSNPDNLKNWGIDFVELGIDIKKYNVILSFSREIKEMKFNRSNEFPFKPIFTVKTVMSKKTQPNTIYIYKIPKYIVRENLKTYTDTKVEK